MFYFIIGFKRFIKVQIRKHGLKIPKSMFFTTMESIHTAEPDAID